MPSHAEPQHAPHPTRRSSAEHAPAPVATKAAQPADAVLTRRAAPQPAAPASEQEAPIALQVAADIVRNHRDAYIANAPPRFAPVLRDLYRAVAGGTTKQPLSGKEQLELLDASLARLEPALAIVRTRDPAWIERELVAPLAHVRSTAQYRRASDRVDHAMRIDGKVVELPEDGDPRERGRVLHAQIQKLIPTIAIVNEQVIRNLEHTIHHEAEALMAGHAHGKPLGPGRLVDLQMALLAINGLLMLDDAELQHHLQHPEGVLHGIATYAELVKAAVEIAAGAVAITAAYSAAIARITGDAALANSALGVVRSAGLKFAAVITCVEVIHGIAVLFDAHATRQQKLDAAVDVATGVTWMASQRAASSGAAAIGAAATTAILLGYAELKLTLQTYWATNLAITEGVMRPAFEYLRNDADVIAREADELARAEALLEREPDPAQRDALGKLREHLAAGLGADIDRLLGDCAPRGFTRDEMMVKYPGYYPILVEAFAPLARHRGARRPEPVIVAARETLATLAWVLAHAGELVTAQAKHQHVGDVKREAAKQEAHHAEE